MMGFILYANMRVVYVGNVERELWILKVKRFFWNGWILADKLVHFLFFAR